jgi:hypothetical protein
VASLLQEDFGGGIYRGRKAPANTVYDALNALINDEGHVYRRPGTSYLSTVDTAFTINGMADVMVGPSLTRTLAWGQLYSDHLWVLDTAASAWRQIDVAGIVPRARAVPVGNVVALPQATNPRQLATFYAGSLKTANYSTGTITVTNGSTTITGVGTAWLANADAGMFITDTTTSRQVIASIVSDTQMTLATPWPGTTHSGSAYTLSPTTATGLGSAFAAAPSILVLAAVGTPARLIYCYNNRAYFTAPGTLALTVTDYHELYGADVITGADSFGDTLVLFTTSGTWMITNMSLDPVDDFGNVQQQIQRVNDLILWGDAGIARYGTDLVIPGTDDVYLFAPDGSTTPITGGRYPGDAGIRPLYRTHVQAGYEPGTAVVYRSHYFLPIVVPSTGLVVDVLVCRLDRGAAWTRWAGHAKGTAYARRVGTTSRSPVLIGVSGTRVTDLTGCLNPSGLPADADTTTQTFTVESNDDDLGPGVRPNTAEKVRFVYETIGGTPTFSALSAIGKEGTTYTAATLKRGGGASDGTDYSAWHVGRKAERIRFKFTTISQVFSLILRRREVTIRQADQT